MEILRNRALIKKSEREISSDAIRKEEEKRDEERMVLFTTSAASSVSICIILYDEIC